MSSLDLTKFPSLFDDVDIFSFDEIQAQRDLLNKKEDSWINETPRRSDLDDFVLDSSIHRYTVTTDDVPFECLYLPSSHKKLLVHLNGGGAATRRYPNFLRWKYKNYFNAHYLSIDDPMYYFHKGITHVMWYYGDKNTSFLQLLIKIVEKAGKQLGIDRENIVFLGSSGGGTAALQCAEYMDNTSAVAVNPQIILADWQYPLIYDNFKKWGVDLMSEDPLNRNIINLTNTASTFAICYNLASPEDLAHFKCFCERHDITPKYGFRRYNNILTWTHATECKYLDLHAITPEKTGLSLLLYLVSQIKDNPDLKLEEYENAGIAINELLNEQYQQLNENKRITDSYNNFVMDLITPYLSDNIKRTYSAEVSGDIEVHSYYRNSYSKNFEINGNKDFFYNIMLSGDKWCLRLMYDKDRCSRDLSEKLNTWFISVSKNDKKISRYHSPRYHVLSVGFTSDSYKNVSEHFVGITLPELTDIANI